MNNVCVNKNEYNTSGDDDRSVNMRTKSSTCPCQMWLNAFGQVKTSRNMKRPKPPLPPMKKKKEKPTRFSQHLVAQRNESCEAFTMWCTECF